LVYDRTLRHYGQLLEVNVLPSEPGQLTAPQGQSHIQPHQDPLAQSKVGLEVLEFFDLQQIWDAFAFRALAHA
jgi:hypothetical protein